MTVICQGLGLLFAFLMLSPHAPVHTTDRPPTVWRYR